MRFILVSLTLNAILFGLSCRYSYGGESQAAAWSLVAQTRVYDVLPVAHRGDRELSLDGEWEIAEAKKQLNSETVDTVALEWKQVRMPATIQYALFQAGAIENPWYGENWKKLQWIQERDWYLRRRFQIPAAWSGRHIRLRFDGMDYTGAVWLDGKLLGIHEGSLGGPTFDITQTATSEREHEILIRLIHETDPQRSMKPWAANGRSYQWVNRFRTIGLWRSIRLVSSGPAYMEAPCVRTDRIAATSAGLWAQTLIANVGPPFKGTVQARIVDLANGNVVWQRSQAQWIPTGTSFWEGTIELPNPKLWWPNGSGGRSLYRLELSLAAGTTRYDSITSRFGIRTLEIRRNPYLANKPRTNPGLPSWLSNRNLLADKASQRMWNRPDVSQGDNMVQDDAMYNSDEAARYLFVVNGRPIYMKGVNWVTSDDLLALTPQREGWLVKAARLGGINLFRLNGGVENFESEQFYNLCDEAGILVWQEFPLTFTDASTVPLSTWREQVKQSVLRIRQHPSLAIYVGGNEFKPFADGLSAYLGMSREIVAEYDDRPFRVSSPNEVEYHSYYDRTENFENLWIGDPNWYLRYYGEDANFIGEWSLAVFGNLSSLKRVTPGEELNRAPVGYDIKAFFVTHPTIADRFAEVDHSTPLIQRKLSWYGDLAKADIAQYVDYSQMAQADVYGLTEGQREGDIEVLEIDEKAGSVKVKNAGTIQTLTFEKDGAKLPSTPAPAVPGAGPGGQPIPGLPVTHPGVHLPSPGGTTTPNFQLPARLPRLPNTGSTAYGGAPNGTGIAFNQPGATPAYGAPGFLPGSSMQGTQTTTPMPGGVSQLSAEEQAIMIEANRERGGPEAALLPPTPLSPKVPEPTVPGSSGTTPTLPPLPGRPPGPY